MKLTEWQKLELLQTILVDDSTGKGGISFEGETLKDYLEETENISLLSEENGLDEVNRHLINSGIRPLYPPFEEETFILYYSNMTEDLSSIPFFTAEEILSEASSHKGESFTSIDDAISYLQSEAEWNPIYSTTQRLGHKDLKK